MTNIVYLVLLYPLESLISIVYEVFFSLLGNVGLSIVGVSLAVNIACLPLYAIAEKWQTLEREAQKALKPKIDSIKAVFKGDERYFILSTYYRQNHYHPVYSLRSTFGLLIQVPFFIAAYNVLANLTSLANVSFLGIPDLAKPDGLLKIAGYDVNLLPLLMTLVNIAASAVYTKGFHLKEKVQLYAMAALFLVLLYGSPSGLVFYWTLNNAFSLAKNLCYKLRNPLRTFWMLMTGLFAVLFALLATVFAATWQALLGIGLTAVAIAFLPMIARLAKRLGRKTIQFLGMNQGQRNGLFILSGIAITLLVGSVIPGTIIASSPQEFSFTQEFTNPLTLLFSTSIQAIGIFFFYPVCLYLLFPKKIKAIFCACFAILLPAFIVNAFCFQGDYGTISKFLTFETAEVLSPTVLAAVLNIQAIVAVIACVAILFAFHKIKPMIAAVSILVVSFGAITVVNVMHISGEFARISTIESAEHETFNTNKTIYSLSKEKKNVCVIILDRAIGSFVPYAFADSPDVAESFSGFTWYPNTASFGGHTIFGAPPLFGGYDYTPDEMNRRRDETLVKKHNEALTSLPRVFSENGWKVTATDMPFANYSWIPDNTIFSRLPNVKALNLTDRYTAQWLDEHKKGSQSTAPDLKDERIQRNMIRFSVLKTAPVFLRPTIYRGGSYWNENWAYRGNEYEFIKFFAPLDYLARLTEFDSPNSNLLLIQNETPHQRAPYKHALPKSATKRFRSMETIDLYEVNLLSYQALGRFFMAMKARGVYDNTRIIIVSDHGFNAVCYSDRSLYPDSLKMPKLHAGYYNPVLLVKDFGETGPLKKDMTFMTNADVPDLATKGGVIQNPVNPWTGHPYAAGTRKDCIHITTCHKYNPSDHGKRTFSIRESEYVWLHDSIFNRNDWETGK